MRNRAFILAVAALLPLAAASGQEVATPSVAPRNVLSIQPINAVLAAYSAEYERQVAAALTLGAGGTYFKSGNTVDDVTYKSGDIKLRYYPNGTALMGFSFGGSAGFSSISGFDINGAPLSLSGPSIGVLLEYQWLLGVKRNFAVALGLGAKAVLVKDSTFSNGHSAARYPTARISVGYAFYAT